jgi:hypothetical protein
MTVTEIEGNRYSWYIIGGGTIRHGTHQQRTFAPHRLLPCAAVLEARSVFVHSTFAGNAAAGLRVALYCAARRPPLLLRGVSNTIAVACSL